MTVRVHGGAGQSLKSVLVQKQSSAFFLFLSFFLSFFLSLSLQKSIIGRHQPCRLCFFFLFFFSILFFFLFFFLLGFGLIFFSLFGSSPPDHHRHCLGTDRDPTGCGPPTPHPPSIHPHLGSTTAGRIRLTREREGNRTNKRQKKKTPKSKPTTTTSTRSGFIRIESVKKKTSVVHLFTLKLIAVSRWSDW